MIDNYWIDRLDAERAELAEQLDRMADISYLTGYYGAKAEDTGNAELRALVRELRDVIDGTWDRSVMTE